MFILRKLALILTLVLFISGMIAGCSKKVEPIFPISPGSKYFQKDYSQKEIQPLPDYEIVPLTNQK